MQDLTFAGKAAFLDGPYTFALYTKKHRDFYLHLVSEWTEICRAPWIYYSRNISTTNTRP